MIRRTLILLLSSQPRDFPAVLLEPRPGYFTAA